MASAARNRCPSRYLRPRPPCCFPKLKCRRRRRGMTVRRSCRRPALIARKPQASRVPARRCANMRRFFLFAVVLTLSFSFTLAARADNAAPSGLASLDDHGDPVLRAMIAELRRSQGKLQLGQLQRPYYIDYQVTELQDFTADAVLGALRSDQTNAGRLVRVVVRIGDYKQDSYFGEGMGAVEVMPTDDQELALRRQLWLATDKAYKAALTGFTEKQAALKNVETENDLVDFSQEKPSQSVRDLSRPALDLNQWKQTLRSTDRKSTRLNSSHS